MKMEIKNITKALIEAKKQFKPVLKNAINPHYNKKYGNIESYLDATEEALLNNGIFVSQVFSNKDGLDYIDTILLHESGESITSNMRIIHSTQDPQKLGSLLTYYRRYAYAAILNLTAEDDDGEVTSKPESKKVEQPKALVDTNVLPRIQTAYAKSKDQLEFLEKALSDLEEKHKDAIDYKTAFDWIVKTKNELIKKGESK